MPTYNRGRVRNPKSRYNTSYKVCTLVLSVFNVFISDLRTGSIQCQVLQEQDNANQCQVVHSASVLLYRIKVKCQVSQQPEQSISPLTLLYHARSFLVFSPRPHLGNVNSHGSSNPMSLSGSCATDGIYFTRLSGQEHS